MNQPDKNTAVIKTSKITAKIKLITLTPIPTAKETAYTLEISEYNIKTVFKIIYLLGILKTLLIGLNIQ